MIKKKDYIMLLIGVIGSIALIHAIYIFLPSSLLKFFTKIIVTFYIGIIVFDTFLIFKLTDPELKKYFLILLIGEIMILANTLFCYYL